MDNDYIVIMCAYNCSHYIVEAIQSVAEQKDVDYGLIVVDDASTDNTVEIVKNLMEHNPRIKLIENETRTGSAAWNQYQAVKKYVTNPNSLICIVDGDDYLAGNLVLKKLDMFRLGLHPVMAGNTHFKLNTEETPVYGFSETRRRACPYHMRFFRAWLYNAVPEDCYYKDGKLIGPASDYAFVYAVLDLITDIAWLRVHSVDYVWRHNLTEHNDHHINAEEQEANARYLVEKQKLDALTPEQIQEYIDNF